MMDSIKIASLYHSFPLQITSSSSISKNPKLKNKEEEEEDLASYQTSRPIPKKHFCSVMMLADNSNPQVNRRSTPLQIKSTSRDQVFENNSEGIVCYESENGEMICEEYDEGPRFQTTPSIVSTFHSRDAEIIDLLQKNWVQLGDSSCSLYKLDKELLFCRTFSHPFLVTSHVWIK